MTWERGRKLSTMTLGDDTTVSYKYNADGIRTQKTVGGVTTDYFLEGSTIVAQKTGNDVIWYYFDSDGTRDAIEYNGTVYYYMYNPQGDVIGLFDGNTNVVVEYTYDSWGKVETTGTLKDTLGKANPFRYRGYYYDEESGFYYLNSRYYYPEIGRFINADGLVQTGQGILDKNMFAYCANNPIIFCDPSGCSYTITMPAVGDGPIYITSDESLTFYFSSTSSTPHNSNPSYGEGMSFINDLVSLGVQLGVDLSRHDVTSQIKPNNISSVTFAKNINSNLKYIDDFSRVSTKALNITGCICIAIGVTENAIINCQNGESWEKIVWDMAIDTIYMSGSAYVSAKLGASIGGAIGSTVPVVGTAAGVIIGMGFGVAIDYCLQETITGVKSWL